MTAINYNYSSRGRSDDVGSFKVLKNKDWKGFLSLLHLTFEVAENVEYNSDKPLLKQSANGGSPPANQSLGFGYCVDPEPLVI